MKKLNIVIGLGMALIYIAMIIEIEVLRKEVEIKKDLINSQAEEIIRTKEACNE